MCTKHEFCAADLGSAVDLGQIDLRRLAQEEEANWELLAVDLGRAVDLGQIDLRQTAMSGGSL